MRAVVRNCRSAFPLARGFRIVMNRWAPSMISKAEVRSAVEMIDRDSDPLNDVPIQLVEKMIEVLDENGDGAISLDEFMALCPNHM
eukprot:scaffold1568_cov200-Pinguiococcus_pyrenoidosus.AAC.3